LFATAAACKVAYPLDGSGWDISPATGDIYFQARDGSVPLPAAGYNYDIVWTPKSAGLAPAGMAASFAALALLCKNSRLTVNRGGRTVYLSTLALLGDGLTQCPKYPD
jgi:hypothetical protein